MWNYCDIFNFFFNDTATTEIYTLSLHDALPIYLKHAGKPIPLDQIPGTPHYMAPEQAPCSGDRKSTRLNSSHANISYAVFCLKKKKRTSVSYIQLQLWSQVQDWTLIYVLIRHLI